MKIGEIKKILLHKLLNDFIDSEHKEVLSLIN